MPLGVTRLCKDITLRDVFQFFFKNLESRVLLTGSDASGKNVTPTGVFQFFFKKNTKK
jgi:hypothetical protein